MRKDKKAGQHGALRRLRKDRRGAMVLEFALVIPLFLMCVFSVIQVGLVLFTERALQAATEMAARELRTGQTRNSSAAFSQTLCRAFNSAMLDCSKARWNVRSGARFNDFAWTMLGNPVPGSSSFAPGTAGQHVVVDVAYRAPLVVPLVATFLTGSIELRAQAFFRNEG